MNAYEAKLLRKDEYINQLTSGINKLNTIIYENKMAADEVNRKKNVRIAELEKEVIKSIIEKNKPEIEKVNTYLKSQEDRIAELEKENQFFKEDNEALRNQITELVVNRLEDRV